MITMRITNHIQEILEAFDAGHRETSLGLVLEIQQTRFQNDTPTELTAWIMPPLIGEMATPDLPF
ncbi:MAG: hypothetical protein OIF40_03980 [Mangrovicoccus sp.]|nr:hypothetical protein [Mangrovicoccus sp.]